MDAWLVSVDVQGGLPDDVALAVATSLVDAHGGSIAIESEVGQGAAFIVSLPLAG